MSAEVDLIFLRAKRRIIEDEDWGATGLPFYEFVESLLLVVERVFGASLAAEGSAGEDDGGDGSSDSEGDNDGDATNKAAESVLAHMEALCAQIKDTFEL